MESIVEPLRALDGADDWDDIDAVEAETDSKRSGTQRARGPKRAS
jgi:hypothetical protein